jgi:serine/threonine protein kinase
MKPIGKYTVVREIGRGGMGVVFEGFDPVLDRSVAIKLLLAETNPVQFLSEARAAAHIGHPNCVTVYEYGTHDDGHPFLVMELVTGVTAAQLIARGGALPWQKATRLIAAAARGLSAVHESGLVHRDIKPSNLLITRSGVVKVADFGLATSAGRTTTSLAGDGVVGTPHYMSPEQCMSEPVDARTDVYALGAAYYHLLTGQPPFVAAHELQVMFAHCNNPVPDPRQRASGVPAGCAEIVLKALAKNPADRYQTMIELLGALSAVLKAEGTDVPSDPSAEHPPLDLGLEGGSGETTRGATATPPLSVGSTSVAAPPVPRPSRRKLLLAVPAAVALFGVGYGVASAVREKPSPDQPPDDPHTDPPRAAPVSEQTISLPAPVAAVAVSPDGRLLAVATGENGKGGVHLFERGPEGFQEKWRKWPDAQSLAVAFSPTRPWLAVVNQVTPVIWDGPAREPTKLPYPAWVVEVWDFAANKLVEFPEARTTGGRIRAVAFAPGGRHLAAGIQFPGRAANTMVRVWETDGDRRFEDLATQDAPTEHVRGIAYSSDGRWLAAADEATDGAAARVVVWEAPNRKQHLSFGPARTRASAAFAGAHPIFAVTERGSVRCYTVPQFSPHGKEIPTERDPDTIALSPDARLLAIRLDGCVRLHDTQTGAAHCTYPAAGTAGALAFAPDGKNLISCHTDRAVRVWVVPETS